MASKRMTSIPGSEKQPLPGAHVVAPAPPDERLEVTVRIRPKNALPRAQDMLKLSSVPLKQLTHAQYEERYGADAKDLALVSKFAKQHNLSVVRESASRRSVILSGSVADFNRAFRVSLQIYAYPQGTYRGRTGPVQIPAELAPVVEGVFGLDNRPVARRHGSRPRAAGNARLFTAAEVAKIYNFPAALDGSGQTIGIIELGGGYRPSDLDTYFSSLGLNAPTVIPVSVDGGTNAPSSASSADTEVVLDIEVAGAAAPGAKFVVYFAPNDAASNGFLDALTKAVQDSENNPSVISISWGGPEQIPTNGFQVQFDKELQAAALLGITVCVAAGDNGAADAGPRMWDGKAHVDFPSSSPFALSCGGTHLITANDAISAESVWNQNQADVSPDAGPDGSFGAGGGGVSGVFSLPDYQQQANVPTAPNPAGFKGRGVPDVTGDGDPDTGYDILVDGQKEQVGGTSAVAPLWAALIALINQKLNGRVGFVNPQLYALASGSGALHDITVGNNRVSYQQFKNVGYDAGPGWDAASGLGSPDGTALGADLKAGTPASAKHGPASKGPKKKRSVRRESARSVSA
ncbi:MAG TPA: S53 family peptidase [Terriglobales bacterium]|nr:S53 family peptidase [Terriglobales bacterium]